MAGRAFAFADPGIIAMATEDFVPCCADDWYQRRRKDAEGEFFRSMADQGPRKGKDGSTRQGIYTLTADGSLLEFKNAGQDAQATREQLERALKKWKALPATRNQPGAVTVPEHGKLDANYTRTPPEGGSIFSVHSRILDKDGDGYCRGKCNFSAGMKAARDFMWLSKDETALLTNVPDKVGESTPMPAAIARRIARFHLIDNTLGEPNFWKKTDVAVNDITITRTGGTGEAVECTIQGRVSIVTTQKDRGYDATLTGTMTITAGRITAFDLAAVGDHWGDDSVTHGGTRPGRTSFGVAFGLADAKRPMLRVPPQAARDRDLYFGNREE